MHGGKQVRLFLIDGTPGGLTTAEIINWTGHVLKGKREKLAAIRGRDEARRTGVYILLGDDDGDGRIAYIGQSDDVAARLTQHDAKKEFWDEVVIVTSKDSNLTSAHVRYLESRLIKMAKSIGRVHLSNGNEPSGGADLPEADASDMDYFIEQLRIVLPVLGVEVFRGREARARPDAAQQPANDQYVDSPIFTLTNRAGVDARAQMIDGEFTVLTGSRMRATMQRPKAGVETTMRQFQARSRLHALAIADAVASPNGTTMTLTQDVVFTSPSAASAVLQGHATANGRADWRTADGITFGAWEEAGVT